MAEAHMAVAATNIHPQKLLRRPSSDEYIEVTQEMLRTSVFRTSNHGYLWDITSALSISAARRLRDAKMAVFNAVFPNTTASWYISLGLAATARHFLPETAKALEAHIPSEDPTVRGVVSVLAGGTGLWIFGSLSSRKALKILLSYRGFLYDPPKKPSLKTQLWVSGVKLLFQSPFMWRPVPRTYSLQAVLPTLSVPDLQGTCQRYLESARPLLDDAEFARMERLADEFVEGAGRTVQWCLYLYSWWPYNYVTPWWERFVYLRGRDSIMINSNYFVLGPVTCLPTNNQIARAAQLISHFARFKLKLERQEIKPLMIRGAVPLCMSQYERLFCTTRIPGVEEDRLQQVRSRHIAVGCQGQYYIFEVVTRSGQVLTPRDIEQQLQAIVKQSETYTPSEAEQRLPAMTAANRSIWANFREEYLQHHINGASLEAIEHAMFMVWLDDSTPEPHNSVTHNHPISKALIHGSGQNLWFDKSFNLVVFANGNAGLNVEHSFADAPVAAHLWEWSLAEEFTTGYDSINGMNKAIPQPRRKLKTPLRLKWDLSDEALDTINDSYAHAVSQIDALDLRVALHRPYSKGFMKKVGFSPDAYIQMALQIAYYRDSGKFTQTYESSMTRLYRDGRTETVRPVSTESVAFVLSMEDPTASKEERLAKLRRAEKRHVTTYKNAMTGKGVDRHLFCLKIMSIATGIKTPFLDEVLTVPWKLSTSQTPAGQTDKWDWKNNPERQPGGGGFGPVADDGYGVSYIVSSDELLSFSVASKSTSGDTSSKRFVAHLFDALRDMKALFDP